MRHLFMEIDDLRVSYGELREEELEDVVPFYVGRDGEDGGFDFAQGYLPSCFPVKSKGFSESELWDMEGLMRDNMRTIYDKIRKVGAWAPETDPSGIETIDRSVGSLNAGEDVIDMFRNIDLRNHELIEQGKAEGRAEGEALAYGLVVAVSKELTRLGRSDEIPAVLAKGREGVEKLAEELGLAQPTR